MTKSWKSFFALLAFMLTVVGANLATSRFGMVSFAGLMVTAGTFSAGLALVARDFLQKTLGKMWTFIAIVVGCFISAGTAGSALAIASGLAFLISELIDFVVFTPIVKRNISAAVMVSSVVSAPVDTILFLHLAGFDVTTSAVLGQFCVKTILALVVALGLMWRSISRDV